MGIAAGLVAVGLFVLLWFQPHKLFIDERVEEPIPSAGPPPNSADEPATSPRPTAPPSSEPVQLARGELTSLDHGTSGVTQVLELADGRRIVRLEDLDTSNGPDLFLYLTTNPASGDEDAFDDDYLSLGRLKGNQGDQNYDLPTDTDLTRFGTVVIWCDRFDSAFGAADLEPTGRER
jgi:hypothetical protein